MTATPHVIYHCSTGRLAAWAAALHLSGPSSEVELLQPFYQQWKSQHRPGGIELVGQDAMGAGVYAWQYGHSLTILTKAFHCFDEIFGTNQDPYLFVNAELPGLRRLGMIAMLNAFTNYGDREMLRWARPHLEQTVQTTMQKLRGGGS